MRRSEGSNFDNVFIILVDKGKEDPNTTIGGPSSARQRIANIELCDLLWDPDQNC